MKYQYARKEIRDELDDLAFIRLLSKVDEIVPVGKILATEPYTDIR
jgi:hypothetical protein